MNELEIVKQLQLLSAEFRHSGFYQLLSTLLDDASEIILQKQECTKVVLCKDCKTYSSGTCWKMRGKMNPNDFCSYGERKDNEQ